MPASCTPETWLHRITAGWHELGDKRAVLLVQLPPSLPRDDAGYFLGFLLLAGGLLGQRIAVGQVITHDQPEVHLLQRLVLGLHWGELC